MTINEYIHLDLGFDEYVWECVDCGAYADLPELVEHMPECSHGTSINSMDYWNWEE